MMQGVLESDLTNELAQALTAESAHAAPAHIVEAVTEELVHRAIPGAPRTIYEELWHVAFWQQITLDWISGIETPYPARMSDAFPSEEQAAAEPWEQLCRRFLRGAEQAALVDLISKTIGAVVLSSAVNGDSALVISATSLPEDSRYARIMRVMKEAETNRPRLRRLADRLGAWYTVLAVGIALIGWIAGGDATRFLAVLVIATPVRCCWPSPSQSSGQFPSRLAAESSSRILRC